MVNKRGPSIEIEIRDNKVIYKRYFDAPSHLVFEAWSAHEHLSQWWGPDGTDYKNKIQFVEIKKPHFIHYQHFGDGEGSKDELERVEKKYGAIEGGKQHVENLAKYIATIRNKPEL